MKWKDAAASSPLGWAVRKLANGDLVFANKDGATYTNRTEASTGRSDAKSVPYLTEYRNNGIFRFEDWAIVSESNFYAKALMAKTAPTWKIAAQGGMHGWAWTNGANGSILFANYEGHMAARARPGVKIKPAKINKATFEDNTWLGVQDHDIALELDMAVNRKPHDDGNWLVAARKSPYGWAVRTRMEGGLIFAHPSKQTFTTVPKSKNPRRVKFSAWDPAQWTDWQPMQRPFGDLLEQANQDRAGKSNNNWVEATRAGVNGWAKRRFNDRDLCVKMNGVMVQMYKDGHFDNTTYKPDSWRDWSPIVDVELANKLDTYIGAASPVPTVAPEINGHVGLRKLLEKYQFEIRELELAVVDVKSTTADNPDLERLLENVIAKARQLQALI